MDTRGGLGSPWRLGKLFICPFYLMGRSLGLGWPSLSTWTWKGRSATEKRKKNRGDTIDTGIVAMNGSMC
jgi:hypothetical protein